MTADVLPGPKQRGVQPERRRVKISRDQVLDIRTRYMDGEAIASIYRSYIKVCKKTYLIDLIRRKVRRLSPSPEGYVEWLAEQKVKVRARKNRHHIRVRLEKLKENRGTAPAHIMGTLNMASDRDFAVLTSDLDSVRTIAVALGDGQTLQDVAERYEISEIAIRRSMGDHQTKDIFSQVFSERAMLALEMGRVRAQGATLRAIEVLMEVMTDRTANANARVKAAAELLDRGGMPARTESINVSVDMTAMSDEELLAAIPASTAVLEAAALESRLEGQDSYNQRARKKGFFGTLSPDQIPTPDPRKYYGHAIGRTHPEAAIKRRESKAWKKRISPSKLREKQRVEEAKIRRALGAPVPPKATI